MWTSHAPLIVKTQFKQSDLHNFRGQHDTTSSRQNRPWVVQTQSQHRPIQSCTLGKVKVEQPQAKLALDEGAGAARADEHEFRLPHLDVAGCCLALRFIAQPPPCSRSLPFRSWPYRGAQGVWARRRQTSRLAFAASLQSLFPSAPSIGTGRGSPHFTSISKLL